MLEIFKKKVKDHLLGGSGIPTPLKSVFFNRPDEGRSGIIRNQPCFFLFGFLIWFEGETQAGVQQVVCIGSLVLEPPVLVKALRSFHLLSFERIDGKT